MKDNPPIFKIPFFLPYYCSSILPSIKHRVHKYFSDTVILHPAQLALKSADLRSRTCASIVAEATRAAAQR